MPTETSYVTPHYFQTSLHITAIYRLERKSELKCALIHSVSGAFILFLICIRLCCYVVVVIIFTFYSFCYVSVNRDVSYLILYNVLRPVAKLS